MVVRDLSLPATARNEIRAIAADRAWPGSVSWRPCRTPLSRFHRLVRQ